MHFFFRWFFATLSVSGTCAVTFSIVFAYVSDCTERSERSHAYGLVSCVVFWKERKTKSHLEQIWKKKTKKKTHWWGFLLFKFRTSNWWLKFNAVGDIFNELFKTSLVAFNLFDQIHWLWKLTKCSFFTL